MFNQSWWQRVYAARDETVMRRGFFSAGLLVMPVVFIAGLLGLSALGTDAAADPSVALFAALLHMPGWLLTVGMVLAMTLVMSSIDTYLNAMVNVFTVDLARLLPGTARRRVLGLAQGFVVLLALAAGYVASRGMSVLYIFLLADLIMTAMVFPVFYGMYQARLGGAVALGAAILGLAGGLVLFPDPAWSRGNLLHSFLAAFAVPALVCLLAARGERFDFGRLKARVKELD
jgi:Na+/proline symporter